MEIEALNKSEILNWLSNIFKDDLRSISFDVQGTSEKGDGYMGDIIFALIKGVNNKLPKEIEAVLKCSKRSDELREKVPVRQAFLNEISMYDSIFKVFRKFEIDRGIEDPFGSVPKYYGNFTAHNMEVIVLENLKKSGYDLWNRKVPLSREYLRAVLREYAKFHAISAAMKHQEPTKFEQLSSKLFDMLKLFEEKSDVSKLYSKNIDELCDLLQNEMDISAIKKWRDLKNECNNIMDNLCSKNEDDFNVIVHGDCWCNNFMFQPASERTGNVPNIAIIDWQIAREASPIIDLSYFLFCGISKEDISCMNEFLDEYYEVFSKRLEQLGSPSSLYSKDSFQKDWKKYRASGLLMCNVVIKICLSEKDEAPDMMDSVTNNLDISETFSHAIKNEKDYKERMSYIIEYAVKEGIV